MQSAAHILAELKAIRQARSNVSPFKNHTEFLRWADKAQSLLAFNPQLAADFKGSVDAATAVEKWRPERYPVAVNGAIGSVNEAITLLEIQIASTPNTPAPEPRTSSLAPPEKVTIRWLIDHVPFFLVVGGAALLVSTFGLGVAFSETHLYALLKSTVASASTTAISKAAYPTEIQPSKLPHIASAPK